MNELGQGLAQQIATSGNQDPTLEQVIQEIVKMLMSGTKPEEIVQMGIPKELVQQAMQMMDQQQQQQGQQPQDPNQQLANPDDEGSGGLASSILGARK